MPTSHLNGIDLAIYGTGPRAQRLLVPVVQALCAQPSVKRHMVPSRRGKDPWPVALSASSFVGVGFAGVAAALGTAEDAAESIAENMLLPLLRHYPAADLQMLVTSIAIHQIERKWSGREVLNCLLHVEELLRSHLEKDMNEGEEENLSNLRVELHSHDFLCKVVLGACTKHASFASQFLCALPDANIDPNGAWKVSMKLFKLVHPGWGSCAFCFFPHVVLVLRPAFQPVKDRHSCLYFIDAFVEFFVRCAT